MKIIIIHSAYGNPDENWIPWLKKELNSLGHQAFVPEFPTPKGQNLQNWLDVFKDYWVEVDHDTVLIGHSISVAFVLNILNQTKQPIKAAYLVSGFIQPLNNPEFDPINKTFYEHGFKWDTIKNNCKSFHIYHSDNDPYVPIERGQEIATKLGVKLNIISGAGHFNISTGYKTFPRLLDDLKKEVTQ